MALWMRILQPQEIHYCIYKITTTKYSNITVVIILQEEGQDGEKKMEMQ